MTVSEEDVKFRVQHRRQAKKDSTSFQRSLVCCLLVEPRKQRGGLKHGAAGKHQNVPRNKMSMPR